MFLQSKLVRLFKEIDCLKLGLSQCERKGQGESHVVMHTSEQVVVDNYVNASDAEAIIRLERKQCEIDDELQKHSGEIASLFDQFAAFFEKHEALEDKHLQLQGSVVGSIEKQAQEIASLISQKAQQDKAIQDLREKKVRFLLSMLSFSI